MDAAVEDAGATPAVPVERRGRRLAAVLVVVGAGAVALGLWRPKAEQAPLLNRAERLCPPVAGSLLVVVSGHELLALRLPRAQTSQPASAAVEDLRTGRLTPLPGLAARLRPMFRFRPLLSPDGRSLLWASRTEYHVTTLDGARDVVWPAPAVPDSTVSWLADSRRWVSVASSATARAVATPGGPGKVLDARLRDAARPRATRTVPVPAVPNSGILAGRLPDGRLVLYEPDPRAVPGGSLLQTLCIDGPAQGQRNPLACSAPVPAITQVDLASVAPTGDRVLWSVWTQPTHSPLGRYLADTMRLRSKPRHRLLVTNLDGSHPRDLAEPSSQPPTGPLLIGWAPDGRHYLVYFHGGQVLRVPTD